MKEISKDSMDFTNQSVDVVSRYTTVSKDAVFHNLNFSPYNTNKLDISYSHLFAQKEIVKRLSERQRKLCEKLKRFLVDNNYIDVVVDFDLIDYSSDDSDPQPIDPADFLELYVSFSFPNRLCELSVSFVNTDTLVYYGNSLHKESPNISDAIYFGKMDETELDKLIDRVCSLIA